MKFETLSADKYCIFVTDGTHDSPKAKKTGRFLITSKHLGRYEIDFSSAKLISEQDYQKVIERSSVEQWDILFSMIGTIGNTYIETNETTEYACKNMGIFKLGRNEKKSKWLYYYLQTPVIHEYILGVSRGTTQGYVPLNALRSLPVKYPSDKERDKIVEVLWNIDQKIQNNKAINKNLEEQAQAIYNDLFANVLFDAVLSDLGTIVGGSTPSKKHPEYYAEQGIAWITPKDLSNDSSKFIYHGENDITELGLSKCSASIMPTGTVLFSSRAPIGYIAIAANPVSTNQGFKSVIPNKDIGTAFIYCFLKNNLPMIESMASGSTFKEISASAMKTVPAFLPNEDSLKRFRDFCNPAFKYQQSLELENKRLANLRDALLPRLMSGEIDVSSIEI